MLIGPKHGLKWWIKFLLKRKWLFEVNLNDTRGLFRTLSNIYYEALRSSQPELFLGKVALKTCNKFTGKHPCQSVNSIKLLCNFIAFTLRHGCSSLNLLRIFRTPFPKNTSGRLLLIIAEILFRFFEQFLKSQIIVIYTFKMYFSV